MIQSLEKHPQWLAVVKIHSILVEKGYKAFLAGGCVRDALLGRPANDLDLATDAEPDQVQKLFDKTLDVGKSFGVIRVILEGSDIEVATFRRDLEYLDGRRPEGVEFSSPEQDAQRRDFTVNALFYDLTQNRVLDYVGGVEDLKKRILRTVGEPHLRFSEDYLRILRGARFVGQLDFEIEEQTFSQMKALGARVREISGERIHEEMGKLLRSVSHKKALEVMQKAGLLQVLFPFAKPMMIKQGPDWYRWAQFFQELPASEEEGVFNRYRFSNKEKRNIKKYLQIWGEPQKFWQMRRGQQLEEMQEEGVRYALEDIASDKDLLQELKNTWMAWGEQLPSPLIGGEDIKSLKGADIGRCLKEVYYQQLEGVVQTREQGLELVRKLETAGHHG